MEIDFVSVAGAIFATAGGGAAVAYAMFRKLGSAWLDARFSERLESFRHDRAKEMAHLRAEIDGTLRARVRYQEKQFEACLCVWNALKEAQSKLLVSVSPLQQYADFNRINEAAQLDYLASLDLKQWEKDEILNADVPQETLVSTINGRNFWRAATAFSEFDRVTRANELFFDPVVYELIRSVCDKMHASLVSKEISIEEDDHSLSREAWKEYNNECTPLIHQLVQELRELLSAPRLDGV